MHEKRFGDRLMLRLEPGEEVLSAVTRRLAEDQVGFAFLSAAGGLSRVRLGYWDARTRRYEHRDFEEQLEVLVMQGNCSLKSGHPFLHLHAVLGRADFSTLGGHVVEAVVNPTFELWIRAEREAVNRVHDPGTGLDLLDLG